MGYIHDLRKRAGAGIADPNLLRFGWNLLKASCRWAPSHNPLVQLVRSLMVSVISLIFDFAVLVFAKEVLGWHYLLAATIGFSIGVAVNYYLSVIWVFAGRKLTSKHWEFVIFVVICVLGLVFNLLIIAGMVESLGADYRLAKAVSTVIVFFWNFIARKKILY